MGAIWTPDKETWSRMFTATRGKADFRRKLLANLTKAELRLWAELSKINVGPKCRRICPWRPQVVIKGWIVDFYNDQCLTAIEVDGPNHEAAEQKARDGIKDTALRHFGLCVVRFTNAEVFRDAAALVQQLLEDKPYYSN